MPAGLSSLVALKAQILPPAMRARTDFDAALTSLGVGVAMLMERYCDRRFTRAAGAVEKFSANNLSFSLARFPVESIASVVLNAAQTGDATTITADIHRADLAAGLVHFSEPPGSQHDTVTITFTGGFWWDASEDASGGSLPSGATALPADILLAFYLQMKAVCESQNLFGLASVQGDSKAAASPLLELIPAVKDILNTYRRF
jgi:hypothetical protein